MVSFIKRSAVFYLGLVCVSLITGCRDDNTKPVDAPPVLEEEVVLEPAPEPAASVVIPGADAAHEKEVEKIIKEESVAFEDVDAVFHFSFDNDTLPQDALAELRSLIPTLKSMPGIIHVEGHTDSQGSKSYNMKLGMRRAQAVAKVLTDHGIDPKRLKLISYGSERPLVRGNDDGAYAENRRVELFVKASSQKL